MLSVGRRGKLKTFGEILKAEFYSEARRKVI
jgi:hypothetical protein